ncbi:MAG: type II toxin-antitoxin system RelE/ParE family toxin [Thermodesulfobacteriota bacterium]
MKVFQSSSFGEKVKKFKKKEKSALDNTIREIVQNPSIGSEKKGDLRGIFVYKFKIIKTEFLLSYRVVGDDIALITIGSHENYYRDLKSYLKNR